MLDNTCSVGPSSSSFKNGVPHKRKRRPAGTPDPDADVVSLSPRTLLESDRYVCEICSQWFQRDQNLQMHRRRHKVPWKLLKRETVEVRKRVFVCPEPSCLHHDQWGVSLLVAYWKHFRRKHSSHNQWFCLKCSKGYAVQSDFKAHLKTCGTRGHSCDCGRVFSRVESFIEHQDACTTRDVRPELLVASQPAAAFSSGTASSTRPLTDANFSTVPSMPKPTEATMFLCMEKKSPYSYNTNNITPQPKHNLELQLLPSSSNTSYENYAAATRLQPSIGPENNVESATTLRSKEEASEQENKLKLAFAEEARQQSKRQVQIAEMEFVNAKRIRQQAQGEFEKAQLVKEQATKKINSIVLQITCRDCKRKLLTTTSPVMAPSDEAPFAIS